MHLLTGIGIGLLGLATAATQLEVDNASPASIEFQAVQSRSISASTEINLLEDAHRWYNESWNELIGMDGEWDEVASVSGVALKPSGEDCSLWIYSRVRDELHCLPVPPQGQVTFVNGWIRVDCSGRLARDLSDLEMAGGMLTTTGGDCDAQYSSHEISEVEIGGDCWQASNGMEDCELALSCETSGDSGCSLDFHFASGVRTATTHFEAECGVSMVFTLCRNADGGMTYCVEQG